MSSKRCDALQTQKRITLGTSFFSPCSQITRQRSGLLCDRLTVCSIRPLRDEIRCRVNKTCCYLICSNHCCFGSQHCRHFTSDICAHFHECQNKYQMLQIQFLGMWRFVLGRVVRNIFEDGSTYIFRVKLIKLKAPQHRRFDCCTSTTVRTSIFTTLMLLACRFGMVWMHFDVGGVNF
jgi:hypothetical protein